MIQNGAQGGAPPDPNTMQPLVTGASAILQDAAQVNQADKLLDRVAKTLELLYEYEVAHQLHPFKQLMKMTVRRCSPGGT